MNQAQRPLYDRNGEGLGRRRGLQSQGIDPDVTVARPYTRTDGNSKSGDHQSSEAQVQAAE